MLLIVLCWKVLFFEFITKSFVDFFATGLTATRVYLFLIFLIISFLLLTPNLKKFVNKPIIKKLKPKYFIILILISLVLCALSFFIYVQVTQTNLYDTTIITKGPEWSNNRLMHIHSNKPVIGFFIRNFFPYNPLRSDFGSPYIRVIPNWIYFLGLVLLLVNIGLSFIFLLKKNYHWLSIKNNKLIFIYSLIYLISSFSIFKYIVDGGPFTFSILITFPLLITILYSNCNLKEDIKNFLSNFGKIFFCYMILIQLLYLGILYTITIFGAVLVVSLLIKERSKKNLSSLVLLGGLIFLTLPINPNKEVIELMIKLFVMAGFFVILFLVSWYFVNKKYVFSVTCSIILIILLSYFPIVSEGMKLSFLFEKIDSGSEIYFVEDFGDSLKLNKLILNETTTIYSFINRHNIFLYRNSFNIANKTCWPGKLVVLNGEIKILQGDYLNSSNHYFNSVEILKQNQTTLFKIFVDSCVPQKKDFVVKHFYENGLDRSVLIFKEMELSLVQKD